MPKTLVIDLVGRICLVKEGEKYRRADKRPLERGPKEEDNKGLWAVFLNIPGNKEVRQHFPLLSVPLSMVKSQEAAKAAELACATFVKPLDSNRGLVDSMGIWKLDGLDLEILNSAKPPGTLRIRDVANLNAIVASVDPGKPATFKSILASAPPSEVVARLKLPSSARVTAITEDPVERTFYPGNYTQPLATYVRCRIPFADDIDEPILRMRSFGGDTIPDFKFDAHKYNELTLTMSNLCKCVDEKEYSEKEHGEREYKKRMNDPDNIIDDPEFSVYNMLLAGTGLTRFPVPTIPLRHGAVRIPLCFSPAQAEV